MTNETETVNPQNHNTLHIPSREEFHRRYGGEIRGYDFCTDYYPISIGQDKGSRIADQIMRDKNHEDKLYMQEVANRERCKKYEENLEEA